MDVLVVDDADDIRLMLGQVLRKEGHTVAEAGSSEQALEQLEQRRFDVVLLDINLPGMSGLDALVQIHELSPETAVIMITGEDHSTHLALLAGRRGAYDFVTKPLSPVQIEYLLDAIDRAARITHVRRATPAEEKDSLGILGDSPPVHALLEQIRKIAPSQGRVLISGENGSGKELVAHAIHALSKRASGPFIKLNCAALPRDLVESELFGHERGAFTTAVQSRKGRIELADHGTLFLDEVGDLALEAQAKLLRAIESGEIERVGGSRTITFDVRFIAATNKDLAARVASEEFREDLYFRLNVLPIRVPPLRERRGDIVPLAKHFLSEVCTAEGRPALALSEGAGELLTRYAWPGNVRELRNLMERAAVLVQGPEVTAEDLLVWLETGGSREESAGLRGEIERREAEAVRRALDSAHWNVTQAASALGIDRTNLHRKMRKYGIERRG
ncbi:MAG TPA: sigma-54 dependent transcriptional regulator [Candidatus Udaeobacter sp.]|jgi:DNA-binding NtrC family response regulator|nr:sigma-54 dependent transcriptional regulator [Candidatus Udaeobacter sp.]